MMYICLSIAADSQLGGGHVGGFSTPSRLAVQASSEEPSCRPPPAHHPERRSVINPFTFSVFLESFSLSD